MRLSDIAQDDAAAPYIISKPVISTVRAEYTLDTISVGHACELLTLAQC